MMEVLVVIGFIVLAIGAVMLLFPVVVVLGVIAAISYMIFGDVPSYSSGDLVGALIMVGLVLGVIGSVVSLSDS